MLPQESSKPSLLLQQAMNYSYTAEAQGKNFKPNFMKIEILKEEMDKSLKVKERTNKKIEEMNKYLKKAKKKQTLEGNE